eukprot:GILJ01001938.1.p1 GENE.GILJ01001938.1~~GILJ01001938.1.p1  ORF type:complete len:1150 (+),score=196.99 GILJ01001938.1:70-3519(+)
MWRRTWLVVVCVLVALLTGTQAIQHLKDGVLPGLVPGVPHPVLPLIHDVMGTPTAANSSTQTSSMAVNDTSEHTSNSEMMNAAQPTCFYSAQPPQPVTPLDSCPSYSTYACCDAETADWVQSEITRKITSRKYDQCPGCAANLKSLGCGLSCSPDQSQFLRRKENHVNDSDTYYQFLQDPPRVEPMPTTIFMVCRSFCESIFHSCGPSVTPGSAWNVWELYKEKQQGAKEFCETLLGEAEGVQLAVVDEEAGVPCFAPLDVNPCCNSNETVCPKPTPTPLPMVQPPIPAVAVPEQPVATATPTPQPTPTPTPLPADPRAVHHAEVVTPTPTPAVDHKHLKEIHYKIVHNPHSKGEGLVPTGYQYKVVQKTYVSDKDPSKIHIVKFVSNDEDETLPAPKPLAAVMPSPPPTPAPAVPKKEKIKKIHYQEEGKRPDPSNITELHYSIENQPDAILSDAELKVLHHSKEVPAARKEIPAHMEQQYGRPAVDHTPYDRQVRQDQKSIGNKFYHALKDKVESSHEQSVSSAKSVKEQIERNMEFLRKREMQRKHMEQLEADEQYKNAILEEQRLERALQEEQSKQEQLLIQQRIEEAKAEAQRAYEEKLQLALEVAEDQLALLSNHTESATEQPPPRPKILKVTPTPTPTPLASPTPTPWVSEQEHRNENNIATVRFKSVLTSTEHSEQSQRSLRSVHTRPDSDELAGTAIQNEGSLEAPENTLVVPDIVSADTFNPEVVDKTVSTAPSDLSHSQGVSDETGGRSGPFGGNGNESDMDRDPLKDSILNSDVHGSEMYSVPSSTPTPTPTPTPTATPTPSVSANNSTANGTAVALSADTNSTSNSSVAVKSTNISVKESTTSSSENKSSVSKWIIIGVSVGGFLVIMLGVMFFVMRSTDDNHRPLTEDTEEERERARQETERLEAIRKVAEDAEKARMQQHYNSNGNGTARNGGGPTQQPQQRSHVAGSGVGSPPPMPSTASRQPQDQQRLQTSPTAEDDRKSKQVILREEDIRIEGQLEKWRLDKRTWERSWFVIRNAELLYYRNVPDSMVMLEDFYRREHPLVVTPITCILSVRQGVASADVPVADMDQSNVFEIELSKFELGSYTFPDIKRIFTLRAPSVHDAMVWQTKLAKIVEYNAWHQGPTRNRGSTTA